MRIYLIGYMAAGKSRLGRSLAEKLGYRFVDLDLLFEERYRISILDFFDKYDEAAFRIIERSLLHETAGMDDVVVSTGGGTPCFFDNMDFIRQSGFSVYLHLDLPDLMRRIKKVKRKRPLLRVVNAEDLEEKVSAQLNERDHFYRRADLVIHGLEFNTDELAGLIRQRVPGG